MVYRNNTGRLGHAYQPTVEPMTVPASVGGVNALDSLAMMPEQDCIYTFNLMPVEYGLQLRKGYREWATGVDGDVRTILPFDANTDDPADNKLWAVTPEGIFNITTDGTTSPTKDVTFSSQTDPAGYGVKTQWTDDAANRYLFYADGVNGLHQYLSGTWSVPTGFTYDPGGGSTAFPVADTAFITAHKLRLWLIQEDSDEAWYTGVASISGDLEKFSFGAKMSRGGNLQGLYTWSVDGGDGVDDYLVAVGRGGDVLIYRGSDPSQPDWTLVGSWFIGAVPNTRRLAVEYGSEMYLLSSYGLTSLRDLMEGVQSNGLRNSPSSKINRFLREDINTNLEAHEWALSQYPADGFIQIITPEPTNTPYVQYNQNVNTKAWGFWEGVPMISAGELNSQYFLGSTDGVVYLYDGVLDGMQLPGGDEGEPITFRTLTAFQAGKGDHAKFMVAGLIRTIGVVRGEATFRAHAVYDYNIQDDLPAAEVVASDDGSVWDSALWDIASWDTSIAGTSYPQGVAGIGRVLAVGLTGSATSRIVVVAWDVLYEEGGFL